MRITHDGPVVMDIGLVNTLDVGSALLFTWPTGLGPVRRIALENGVRYAYTGNVHDHGSSSTHCHHCGKILIDRDWDELDDWNLSGEGRCLKCGTRCAGVFDGPPSHWGARRQLVRLENYLKSG